MAAGSFQRLAKSILADAASEAHEQFELYKSDGIAAEAKPLLLAKIKSKGEDGKLSVRLDGQMQIGEEARFLLQSLAEADMHRMLQVARQMRYYPMEAAKERVAIAQTRTGKKSKRKFPRAGPIIGAGDLETAMRITGLQPEMGYGEYVFEEHNSAKDLCKGPLDMIPVSEPEVMLSMAT